MRQEGNSVKLLNLAATGVLSLALAAISGPAMSAEAFPTKPIKMIVPSAAGGTPDTLLRALAHEASQFLGQSIVVENKPGGSGIVGISDVARATPDGYTVAYANNVTLSINRSTFKELPYDPDALTPVVFLFKVPNVMAIRTDSPIKSYDDLLKHLKEGSKELTFSSPGAGTSGHLTGELLAQTADVKLMHVPYRGSPQAVIDVIGGQVDMIIDNSPTMLPHIRDGKLRPLVVASLDRLPQLPDVPTISESGLPNFESVAWGGLVAPPGTPPEVVKVLHSAFIKALNTDAVKERFDTLAAIRVGGEPQDLMDYAKVETKKWAAVVEQAGIAKQ
jgi:tripartite-type tricarboxylate transporter receptor subunit TctC